MSYFEYWRCVWQVMGKDTGIMDLWLGVERGEFSWELDFRSQSLIWFVIKKYEPAGVNYYNEKQGTIKALPKQNRHIYGQYRAEKMAA